jgi:hypothetical protein
MKCKHEKRPGTDSNLPEGMSCQNCMIFFTCGKHKGVLPNQPHADAAKEKKTRCEHGIGTDRCKNDATHILSFQEYDYCPSAHSPGGTDQYYKCTTTIPCCNEHIDAYSRKENFECKNILTDSNLPEGMSCQNCFLFFTCRKYKGVLPNQRVCMFKPVRFEECSANTEEKTGTSPNSPTTPASKQASAD